MLLSKCQNTKAHFFTEILRRKIHTYKLGLISPIYYFALQLCRKDFKMSTGDQGIRAIHFRAKHRPSSHTISALITSGILLFPIIHIFQEEFLRNASYITVTVCMGKVECQNFNENFWKKPSTFGVLQKTKQTKTTQTKNPHKRDLG